METPDDTTSRAVGGSIFQSYTISRENSFSPDEDEFAEMSGRRKEEAGEVSDDSGTGRSTGVSRPASLASSAPKEELAREMLRAATRNSWGASKSESATLPRAGRKMQYEEEDVEVIEVQTVGQLKPPSFNISSSLLQSVPLGSVPGKSLPTSPGHKTPATGHPSLGKIPGRSFSTTLLPEVGRGQRQPTDFDETEPLGKVTTTPHTPEAYRRGFGSMQDASVDNPLSSGQEDYDETEPLTNTTSSLAWDAWEPSLHGGLPDLGSIHGGHPGIGSLPGGQSSLGTIPGGQSGLGSIAGGHPSLGSIPGGHPGLGSIPGGHPGLGSIPGRFGGMSGGQPGLGSLPGLGLPSVSLPGMDCHPMMVQSSMSNSMCTITASRTSGLNRGWSQESEQRLGGQPTKGRDSSKFNDSGVISGDYSEEFGGPRRLDKDAMDIDAMSDGGFSDIGNYPGIRVASKESSEPLSLELEATLRSLNPADVERRRKLMGRNYR